MGRFHQVHFLYDARIAMRLLLLSLLTLAACKVKREPADAGSSRKEAPTVESAARSDVEIRAVMRGISPKHHVRTEWVQLRNDGATNVDLAGWRLESKGDPGFTFPAGARILSGGRLDLGNSRDPSHTGDVRVQVVYSGVVLDSMDDWIVLRDDQGRRADSVGWHRLRADIPLSHYPANEPRAPASQSPGSGAPVERPR